MSINQFSIAVSIFLMSACATKQRLSSDELAQFKINCEKRYEQYEFLESQKYSSDERIILYLQTLYPPTLFALLRDGTFKDNHDGMDGKHEAMIRMTQRQLREHCALTDLNKQQIGHNNDRSISRDQK
jgi:hypothetical protein